MEDIKKIQSNAKTTLALLEDRNIRPTPHNYAIWYEYLMETNPDLNRAVNEHIAKNGCYTDKIGLKIYASFFTREKEGKAVRETNQLFQKSMEDVIGDLNKSSAGFSSYGEQLNDFAAKAEGLSSSELKDVVAEIVSQTNSMFENTTNLHEGLDSASREIAELKIRLQNVQKEAYTDSLTGIANRKSFDKEILAKISHAQENDTNLCLIMADIDHFKNFNDTHGHTFGDQVIKLVAVMLSNGINQSSIAARYGGEEFGVILPATELNDAVNLANDMRLAISAKKLIKRSTQQEVGKITMSFGVTSYAHREDVISFINRADQALYAAKNAGRNRVNHMEPLITA